MNGGIEVVARRDGHVAQESVGHGQDDAAVAVGAARSVHGSGADDRDRQAVVAVIAPDQLLLLPLGDGVLVDEDRAGGSDGPVG